jgi:hypothetical protein
MNNYKPPLFMANGGKMTYVLGAYCSDGVVLVADRKAMGNPMPRYVSKIRKIARQENIVFVASGQENIYEQFLEELTKRAGRNVGLIMEQNKQTPFSEYSYTSYNFVGDAVGLINEMKMRYAGSRLEPFPPNAIQMLFVYRELENDKMIPKLFYFDWFANNPTRIYNYCTLGVAPSCDVFLKNLSAKSTMNEAAKIGAFIIKYMEKEKMNNEAVGVGDKMPQVWFFPLDKEPYEAQDKELNELFEGIDAAVEEMINFIGSKKRVQK